ncbi:MAG: ATPase, T2SS/T4P/T4SS family [Thermoplasmatota archaeon]
MAAEQPAAQQPPGDPPHLTRYLATYEQETGRRPVRVETITPELELDPVDLVYPLDGRLFVHIHPVEGHLRYHVVEPRLEEDEQAVLRHLRDTLFDRALYEAPPEDQEGLERDLKRLFDEAVKRGTAGGKKRAKDGGPPALPRDPERLDTLQYHLIRDVARYGPLEPFMLDPYLEDIQAVGASRIHVIHKDFDMLESNVQFDDDDHVDTFVRNLSERLGRPVSDARPIVDATLSDGSRINIVYSNDVSRRGPSFSIRRVKADPISVTQLIRWGTLTSELAAYVWLCLENGMSLFVCGEAACGKSATLNALLSFIDPRSKIYTAEDTPEVRPPHPVWQRLLTRETGPEESRVVMFDLLRAALRSRPNYIVVGEIRGAEGAVAFQAMQTGHPTVATFHAADKVKMIQRLSAPPINIPLTFMDNLNVALFQQAFHRRGRLVRRITSVDEIQGFSELEGGIITLPVFAYDAKHDDHGFQGNNNSFVLEQKIAAQHGYEDPSEIYRVLARRAQILEAMVENDIIGSKEVNRVLQAFADGGEEALPFRLPPARGP